MATLDLTSFHNAITQLEAGLQESAKAPDSEIVRDAVIKRFEFTYDLSTKMMRRFLLDTASIGAEIEEASFPDLVRLASDRGLVLNGWDKWFHYRKSRNITSHTYDRAKAMEVFAIVPAFLEEARTLHDRLAERLNA